MARQFLVMFTKFSGFIAAMASAVALAEMISASATSWLPSTWSGLEWVFTSRPMRSAAGTDLRISSSMSAVIFTPIRVSTSKVSPRLSIRPALLQPQVPSGCR